MASSRSLSQHQGFPLLVRHSTTSFKSLSHSADMSSHASERTTSYCAHEECPEGNQSAFGGPYVLLEVRGDNEINHCDGCRNCWEMDSVERAWSILRGLGTPGAADDVVLQPQRSDIARSDEVNAHAGPRTSSVGHRTSPASLQRGPSPTTHPRESPARNAHQQRNDVLHPEMEDRRHDGDAQAPIPLGHDTDREVMRLARLAPSVGFALIITALLISLYRDATGVFWFAAFTAIATWLTSQRQTMY